MQIVKTESGQMLKLCGALLINSADELQAALRDFVCDVSEPSVDLSGVDQCDTAALQLLCCARLTAERSSKPFVFSAVSDAIRETSAALGISLEPVVVSASAPDGTDHVL